MSAVIGVELKVFLVFVLHGICILLGSDLLRSLRRAIPHNGFWTGLEDALFWTGVGLWTFLLIFIYQDGMLRLYTAAAVCSGMVLYRKTASPWVIRAVSGMLCLIVRFISGFFKKIDGFRQKVVAKFVGKE